MKKIKLKRMLFFITLMINKNLLMIILKKHNQFLKMKIMIIKIN